MKKEIRILPLCLLATFVFTGCKPEITVEFYDAKIPMVKTMEIKAASIQYDRDNQTGIIITNATNTKKKVILSKKEYDKIVTAFAKLLYGECRGVKSKTNQACVLWCVLNRYDSKNNYDKNGKPKKSILKIATNRGTFHGYNKRHPVKDCFKELAKDVLDRWIQEKQGEKEVGRVLPKGYVYFANHKGYNRFRKYYKKKGQEKITPKHSEVYGD